MTIQDIFNAVIGLEEENVVRLVKQELDKQTEVSAILNGGLISAMDEVGRRFSEGELFVPEMLRAARVMKAGLEILRPLLSSTDLEPAGIVVIGTVKGDLHDIGKNLVAMMLEGAGFNVIDLGVDVDADKFLAAVKGNNADIVAMSALLTTTMSMMKNTIDVLTEDGLRDQIKVMVGGAPVTQSFADEIGVEGYSEDAVTAVQMARKLVGTKPRI